MVEIKLESLGFEPLTQSRPIFHTKNVMFMPNFHQENVEQRGQTQCLEAL